MPLKRVVRWLWNETVPEPSGDGPAHPAGDRIATTFVLLVWLAMFVGSLHYINTFAPRFPVMDETSQWDLIPPQGQFSWAGLWRPHNVHRIPIPRFVHWAFYRGTGSLLPAMWFQAFVLGAVALGLMAVARRVRGRSVWSDSFFPLAWMHIGNCNNLLSGFQLALTLPTAIATAALAAIAISPRTPATGRAASLGSCLLALPLCGAVGLVHAPILAAWAAWAGWSGLRSVERRERRGSRVLLASVLLCALICFLHVWNFPTPGTQHFKFSAPAILSMGIALVSLGIGPAAQQLWPASAIYSGLVLAATVRLLTGTIRRNPVERVRGFGIAAAIAGALAVVVSIGIGRVDSGWNNRFAVRYITLTVPILCSAYLTWTLYGSRVGRGAVCGVLAVVAWIVLPANVRVGRGYGMGVRRQTETLELMVQRGDPAVDLLGYFSEHFLPYRERSRQLLRDFCELRRPPFDRGSSLVASDFDYVMFARPPARIESDVPPSSDFTQGEFVLFVHTGTAIHFELRPADRRLYARFGVPPFVAERHGGRGTRIAIDLIHENGTGDRLFTRELEPFAREADRGIQSVGIELPPHGPGEIVLRTESPSGNSGPAGRSYWFGVAFE